MDERAKLKETIARKCDEAGCDDKARKRHFELFVDRNWDVHPPQRFTTWWARHPHFTGEEVSARKAWNCQCYRNGYIEAKEVGAA